MYVAFRNRKTRLFFDFAYQDMQTHIRFFVYFISKALLICINVRKMKIKFQIIWETGLKNELFVINTAS